MLSTFSLGKKTCTKRSLSSANASFGKKGYMITPIIFIAFLLISVVFALFVSGTDSSYAEGVIAASSVEKSISDIYELQADQINLAKLFAYTCSETFCYPSNETGLENCIRNNLTDQYNETGWGLDVYNQSGKHFLQLKLSSFNATNINMTSDRITIDRVLSKDFLNVC
jgi:hypothetical protein